LFLFMSIRTGRQYDAVQVSSSTLVATRANRPQILSAPHYFSPSSSMPPANRRLRNVSLLLTPYYVGSPVIISDFRSFSNPLDGASKRFFLYPCGLAFLGFLKTTVLCRFSPPPSNPLGSLCSPPPSSGSSRPPASESFFQKMHFVLQGLFFLPHFPPPQWFSHLI